MLARLLRRLHAPIVAATLTKEEMCLALAAVARIRNNNITPPAATATTTTPLLLQQQQLSDSEVSALALRAQHVTPLCTTQELRMIADGAVALAWRRRDVADVLVRVLYTRCCTSSSSGSSSSQCAPSSSSSTRHATAALPRLVELAAVANAALDADAVYNSTLAHVLRTCAVRCLRPGSSDNNNNNSSHSVNSSHCAAAAAAVAAADTTAAVVQFANAALRCECATMTTTTMTTTSPQRRASCARAIVSRLTTATAACSEAQRDALEAWARRVADTSQAGRTTSSSDNSSGGDGGGESDVREWDVSRARRVVFAAVEALTNASSSSTTTTTTAAAEQQSLLLSDDALVTAVELLVHFDLRDDVVAHATLSSAAVTLLSRSNNNSNNSRASDEADVTALLARLRRAVYRDELYFADVRHAFAQTATTTATTADDGAGATGDAMQPISEVALVYDAVVHGRAVSDEQLFRLTTSFAADDATAVAQTACVLAECRGSVPTSVHAALQTTARAPMSVAAATAALRAAWRDESGALLPRYAPSLLRRIAVVEAATPPPPPPPRDDEDDKHGDGAPAIVLRRGGVDEVRGLLRALSLPRPRRHHLADDHADAEAAARAACRAYVCAYLTTRSATAAAAAAAAGRHRSGSNNDGGDDVAAAEAASSLAAAVALACDAAVVDEDGAVWAASCACVRDALAAVPPSSPSPSTARAQALLALRLCVAYDRVDEVLLEYVATVLQRSLRVACARGNNDSRGSSDDNNKAEVAAACVFVHDVVVLQSRLDAPMLQTLCAQLLHYATAAATDDDDDDAATELYIAAAYVAADARRYGDVVRLHARLARGTAVSSSASPLRLSRLVDMLWHTSVALSRPTPLLCDVVRAAAATTTTATSSSWTPQHALRLLAAYARSRRGGDDDVDAGGDNSNDGATGLADGAALAELQCCAAAALATPTACEADVYAVMCAYAPRCRRGGDDDDGEGEFGDALLGALVEALPRALDSLTPRQLADAVAGLGDVPHAGQKLTHQLVTGAVADYVVDNAAVLLRSGRDVARLLYGLARLHHTRRGLYSVAAARLSRRAVLATLDRASAALALAGFGAARFLDRELFDRLARACVTDASAMTAAEVVLAVRAYSRVVLLNDAFYDAMGAQAARRARELPASAQRELLHIYGALQLRHDTLATALLDSLARQPAARLGDANAVVDVLASLWLMGRDVRDGDAAAALADAVVRDAARLRDEGVAQLCGLLAGARWRHLPLLHALGDQAVRLKQQGELTATTSRAVLDTLAGHLLHHPLARNELSALARSVSKEALVLSSAEEEQLNMLLAR